MQRICLRPSNSELVEVATRHILNGRWSELHELVGSFSSETAYVVLRLAGKRLPLTADVRTLIDAGDALSLTAAGAVLYQRAMRFRGLDKADRVSDEQWELYIPTLAHAQELLTRAVNLDPSLGLAAAWQVAASAEGTDEDKDAAQHALTVAVDVPVSGLSRVLTMRSQKWGGSHRRMWTAARRLADPAKPATMALIAKAHFEQWLWFAHFEKDQALAGRAATYFGESDVIADLARASEVVLAADSRNDPRSLIFADNCFAVAFWAGRLARTARPHLQRLGSNVDEGVWLFNFPKLELARARLSAGLLPIW